MFEFIRQNRQKTIYFSFFTLILTITILLAVVYKNEDVAIKIEKDVFFKHPDIRLIKEYLLSEIKSPYVNIDYQIKKGDSIQKILSKLGIKNAEIQEIIKKFKKYGNPSSLKAGNRIEIIIKEDLTKKQNSVTKFSIPITKSTTIEILKNDENKLIAKKIITKLYKRKVFAENVISKNLYTSAINAKINPETIIEFARILVSKSTFKEIYERAIILKWFTKDILMKVMSL